jgi:glycosyltransferase involved in cell wall biosynthesis
VSDDRPSVLYVITDLEIGGVPLHLARLAPAVAAHGWNVAVACLAKRGPVADRIEARGVRVFPLNAAGRWDARCIARLARVIDARRPTIVHSLLFHANLAARVAAAWVAYPASRVVSEIQTVEIERRWHLWLDRRTFHLCAIEIGNSEGVIEHLAWAGGLPRDRLKLIEGGADIDRIVGAKPVSRAEIGVPEDAFVWLWTGRLDPIKGLDGLIDAFADVTRDDPASRLVLVGDGPERRRIDRQVRERKLGRAVRLLGMRDDVPSLLRSADAFVFPSRTEGFPNALLEAMVAGLPCLASDISGCRALIADGITGRLLPVDDRRAWSEAMVRLRDDAALRGRLGASAAESTRHRYSVGACVERTLTQYAALLG